MEETTISPLKGKKPNKKVLIYGGAAAGGFVLYRYWKSRQTPATASVSAPMDSSVAQGGGGSPGTYSGIGAGTSILTDADWTNEVVSLLTAQGWDGQAVLTALGKYLNGQSLTDSEVAIVQAALAVAGTPPSGSHNIIRTGPTPTPTPTPTPPPAGTPKPPTPVSVKPGPPVAKPGKQATKTDITMGANNTVIVGVHNANGGRATGIVTVKYHAGGTSSWKTLHVGNLSNGSLHTNARTYLRPGNYSFQATYSGNSTSNASTSPAISGTIH